MVFLPPKWVPSLSRDPPDSITISDFMLDDRYGRHPIATSRAPFTCGLTGNGYSAAEIKQRVENLAVSLERELQWNPIKGSEWDKVGAVFALNTIDTMTVIWAIHRLGGIATPANSSYSVSELVHQLRSSGARALFTCLPLLEVALGAAKQAGISEKYIYILDLPVEVTWENSNLNSFRTVNQLIAEGAKLSPLPKLRWQPGQGIKQVALLSYSSGTSGTPKAVMISHRNVISNVLQIDAFDRQNKTPGHHFNVLGMMPQSHIYGLIVICHATFYGGNGVITLPSYNFSWMLEATQKFHIETLFIVPPVIIRLAKNYDKLRDYDLSSVKSIWTGAAPLGKETALKIEEQHPTWKVLQGYGLTETCTLVSSTPPHDQFLGSSGSLLPGMQARLVSPEGQDISTYNTPGELYIHSKSNALGYLNNKDATMESFPNGWMRTGDEALFQKSSNGHDHLFIVDRIKELIKVKGHQVAPAELEAHLLAHPSVADVAVIQVLDENAGELPKAFIVRSPDSAKTADKQLRDDIYQHVASEKARYKWLDGGIEFVEEIPKSPSGKILRRMLRDLEAKKTSKGILPKL